MIEDKKLYIHFERPTENGFDSVIFELPTYNIVYKEGNYTQDTTETYYGEAMAAVRSDGNGPVKILVSDENTVYTCEIPLF